MKLVLHIGTEKTGTTSLQNFCHHHRAALRERGVLYPAELGGANHRLVAACGMTIDTADEFVRGLGITDAAGLAELQESTRGKLRDQVDAAAAESVPVCVLSSEHLHSRLRTSEQVDRVAALLEPLFDEIEVLVHLRPQLDVAISLASTQTRVGGPVRRGFFDRVTPEHVYYNYDRLVEMWEAAFGAECVRCVAFRRTPDILGHLFSLLEVSLSGLPAPARVNEALDVRTMAMVNALVDSGRPERIDFRILDRLPVEEKLTPDLMTAQGIQGRFMNVNRTLTARRDDLEECDLRPDWRKFPDQGNLEVLDQRSVFGSALAALLVEYNSALSKTESEGPAAASRTKSG